MATLTKPKLSEEEAQRVEQLCAEFDPERFVPEWMKERGDQADWEAYLRFERDGLRAQLEVAAAFGRSLHRLESDDIRLQIFHGLASELTKASPGDDYEGWYRFHELFTKEEDNRLSDAQHEACETACRRALFIDKGPQAVAS